MAALFSCEQLKQLGRLLCSKALQTEAIMCAFLVSCGYCCHVESHDVMVLLSLTPSPFASLT